MVSLNMRLVFTALLSGLARGNVFYEGRGARRFGTVDTVFGDEANSGLQPVRLGALAYARSSPRWANFGDTVGMLEMLVELINAGGGIVVGGVRRPVELYVMEGADVDQAEKVRWLLDAGVSVILNGMDDADVGKGGLALATESGALSICFASIIRAGAVSEVGEAPVRMQLDPPQLLADILKLSELQGHAEVTLLVTNDSRFAPVSTELLFKKNLVRKLPASSGQMTIEEWRQEIRSQLQTEETVVLLSPSSVDCVRLNAAFRAENFIPKLFIATTCEYVADPKLNVSYTVHALSWDPTSADSRDELLGLTGAELRSEFLLRTRATNPSLVTGYMAAAASSLMLAVVAIERANSTENSEKIREKMSGINTYLGATLLDMDSQRVGATILGQYSDFAGAGEISYFGLDSWEDKAVIPLPSWPQRDCMLRGLEWENGVCIDCQPGYYEEQGCFQCEPGRFTQYAGQLSCQNADLTEYVTAFGQSAPERCPAMTVRSLPEDGTFVLGVSREQCECEPASYSTVKSPEFENAIEDHQIYGLPGHACLTCPSFGDCEGQSSAPMPRNGYFGDPEVGEVPTVFYQCRTPEICRAGYQCAREYDGWLCDRVKSNQKFIGLAGFAYECPNGTLLKTLATLTLLVAVLVIWFFLNFYFEAYSLEIFLSNAQNVAILASFNHEWPASMRYFNVFLTVALFDVDIVTPDCMMGWSKAKGFYTQLLLVYGSILIFVPCLVKKALGRRHDFSKAFALCLSVIDVQYVTVCQQSFLALTCVEYVGFGRASRLDKDLRCNSNQNKFTVVVAALTVIIVIFGVPHALALALQREMTRNRGLHDEKFAAKYGSAFSKYRPPFHQWKLLQSWRTMAFCAIAVSENSVLQVTLASFFSALALVLQARNAPMRLLFLNKLEAFGNWYGFVFVVSCSMLQFDRARGDWYALVVVFGFSVFAAVSAVLLRSEIVAKVLRSGGKALVKRRVETTVAFNELTSTLQPRSLLAWAGDKKRPLEDFDDMLKVAVDVQDYVADSSVTSVFSADSRALFWRDVMRLKPGVITYVLTQLPSAERTVLFGFLVRMERSSTTDFGFESEILAPEDHSSLLYYLFCADEAATSRIRTLLHQIEASKKAKNLPHFKTGSYHKDLKMFNVEETCSEAVNPFYIREDEVVARAAEIMGRVAEAPYKKLTSTKAFFSTKKLTSTKTFSTKAFSTKTLADPPAREPLIPPNGIFSDDEDEPAYVAIRRNSEPSMVVPDDDQED